MKKVHILLVEDNEGDIVLTLEAFEEGKIKTKISVVKNGQDALDYLYNRGKYEKAEKPDLILLDINIPIITGLDVLKEVKTDTKLKKIPVIVLTTSSNEKDINMAYQNHANSYIVKPIELEDFLKAVLKIEEFWIQLTTLAK
ncbi:response regulator [Algoriphagus sp. C2-6-M1]|uniref:response regulator n=1 Tax=Algoriphagus persicinus TaxID=3108754 RepID=UPI002B3EBD20|nr:response regulator [Algoriphagus sp. C2-6-M1]MEB2782040.1 response regulator [Algoriphagus sp. C2-6-M1]